MTTPPPPPAARPAAQWQVAGYRLLGIWICTLPAPIREAAAEIGGALALLVARRSRRIVCGNVAVVLGTTSRWRIWWTALRAYQAFARYLIEFVAYPTMVPQLIARSQIRGWAAFREAASTRGVVAVSAHFSSSIAASSFAPLNGLPTWCVMSTQHRDLLRRVFPRRWRLTGQRLIVLEQAMRQCARALATPPVVVALMGDIALGERGVEVLLCGRRVRLPQGPARLALRTGATLMPGFPVRLPGGRLRFEFGPAIPPPPGMSMAAQAVAMTQAYARRLEDLLRRHPEQWFMFRPMFLPETTTGDAAAG